MKRQAVSKPAYVYVQVIKSVIILENQMLRVGSLEKLQIPDMAPKK